MDLPPVRPIFAFPLARRPNGPALETLAVLALQAALIIVSTRVTTRVNNTAVATEIIGIVGLTVLLLIVAAIRGLGHWSNLTSTGPALVVGAEHVSFSAAVTLAHAGARVVALVAEYERQQSYAAFRLGAAVRWRVPVWTACAVRRVAGRGRRAGVELADVRSGAIRFVPCDTVVFTGDWIPDHELARLAGLAMDPGTRGPAVDTTLATSAAGEILGTGTRTPARSARRPSEYQGFTCC